MSDLTSFLQELQELTGSKIQEQKDQEQKDQEQKKGPKLVLVTTHTNQVNGYSKVAHYLLQELAKHNIQCVHFATQRMTTGDLGRKYPSTVKVVDATALEKEKQLGFAFSDLPTFLQAEKPDIVLLYNDLSVICTYIEQLRKMESRSYALWAYVDITYPYPPQPMLDLLNRDVQRIFTFTRAWKDHLKELGTTRPITVLPHAVDPALFHPIPRDVARQTLGLPKEPFFFLSLNKNIPRKRLDLLIMAFSQLIVRFPTKPLFLLIVADKGDRGGYPLFDIFAREIKRLVPTGNAVEMFGNRLFITSKDTAYKDEDINLLYNCGDAHVSCAEGEGFGLCTFESMAAGIPQIVPNIRGYTEYCTEDNSLLVPTTSRHYLPQAYHAVTGEVHTVNPEDIAKAMERYVFEEDLRKAHAHAALQATKGYTWSYAGNVLMKFIHQLKDDEA